jgi:2-dehydro-3-deoxy-D-arabinonate dehydratase
MQIAKYVVGSGRAPGVGIVEGGQLHPLASGARCLSELLHDEHLEDRLGGFSGRGGGGIRAGVPIPLDSVRLLAPIDAQEVWGAGVTYERSKVARQEESEQGGSFYDQVYRAARPELFFKATPSRVAGPGQPIRVRRDTRWCVPEPELTLVLNSRLDLVGYTIGNDVSSRDIEGENPLYLPQAKVYDQSCALGPVVVLPTDLPPRDQIVIEMTIERQSAVAFQGSTRLSQMARTLEDLVEWLGRENSFPHGAVLLTGTGVVPPDDFSLRSGDRISIEITGIGRLMNFVA